MTFAALDRPAVARVSHRGPAYSGPVTVLWISVLLIVPCFWQPLIQAGDLSSHLYNAWLASEVERGRLDGFDIVPVWTNVLTDWILAAAVPAVGAGWAARMVVVPSVLLFFWGAFFLLDAATGRRPWSVVPVLVLLTYGLIFHLGFLNFYVSTGMCLWMLGLLLKPSARNVAIAVALAVPAVSAHPLPVLWAAAVFAYVRTWAVSAGAWRAAVPALGVAGLAAARLLLGRLPHVWSPGDVWSWQGLASLTAIEQVLVFDQKYALIAVGLGCVFLILLNDRLRRPGALADPWFQVWILHLAGVMILPTAVGSFTYIPQRLSWFTALSFCLAIRGAKPAREVLGLSSVVVAAFAAFLFMDHRAYNHMENDIARATRRVPDGARVVAVIVEPGVRVNAMAHVADRVCIGRCFSYGNYESPSGWFRLRLRDGNRTNVASNRASQAISSGEYVVSAADDPIYAVCACEADDRALCVRTLHAGERVCTVNRPISIRIWN